MEYVTFEGEITPLEWGKSTYTILAIPGDIVAALGNTRRVEGEIGEHPVNLALTKSPATRDVFVYTGKSFLRQAGLGVGDRIEVRLRPAADAEVEVPDDVMLALRGAGQTESWAALTPGKQRGLLHGVQTVKRAETRAKRIAALIAEVA